jgi:hypothetical protein
MVEILPLFQNKIRLEALKVYYVRAIKMVISSRSQDC